MGTHEEGKKKEKYLRLRGYPPSLKKIRNLSFSFAGTHLDDRVYINTKKETPFQTFFISAIFKTPLSCKQIPSF